MAATNKGGNGRKANNNKAGGKGSGGGTSAKKRKKSGGDGAKQKNIKEEEKVEEASPDALTTCCHCKTKKLGCVYDPGEDVCQNCKTLVAEWEEKKAEGLHPGKKPECCPSIDGRRFKQRLKSMVVELPKSVLLNHPAYKAILAFAFRGFHTPFNEPGGQYVAPCASYNNDPENNIATRQVMRSEFAMPIGNAPVNGFVERYKYGSGHGSRSVGAIQSYVQDMCDNLMEVKDFAETLLMMAYPGDKKIARKSLNHGSLMPYLPAVPSKVKHMLEHKMHSIDGRLFQQLGFHCDQTFNDDGTFDPRNSQEKDTPVIIFSFGDTRELKWKRARLKDGKVHVWNDIVKVFKLGHLSVWILHPDDENPKAMDDFLWQFRHGGVKWGHKGKFCFALAFRTVRDTAWVNPETNEVKPKTPEEIARYLAARRGKKLKSAQKRLADEAEAMAETKAYLDDGAWKEDHAFVKEEFLATAKEHHVDPRDVPPEYAEAFEAYCMRRKVT